METFSKTNVTFFLYLLKNIPLGCRSVILPDRMLGNPTIKWLLSNSNRKPYYNNLVFFRVIALEIYGSDSLALKTDQIFQRFNERSEDNLEGFTYLKIFVRSIFNYLTLITM